MDKFFKQLESFLRGLNFRQRILLGASVALVIAVIALFVWLTRTADFKPLYTGLAPADAQEVVQSLAARNVAYQISTDGATISVPADQLDQTRLALAGEGMPQTGRMGFELFDKPNWAGSDFSEQVNYQRALEGELERTIQTLGNVQSVRVHLVMPHDSLFTDRERGAKAAVVLKARGGGLSDDESNAITHLVANAVDNLSPQNVTLIGADGRSPVVSKGRDAVRGEQASIDLEAGLAEKLVSTISPMVGSDRVKASVSVAYDESSEDITQELYDPNNAVLVSSQVQEESFGGTPPMGIPGTTSNVPGATGNAAATLPANAAKTPPAPTGAANQAAAANPKPGGLQPNPGNPMVSTYASETSGQHSESRTFAVSKTLRHVVDPPGRVRKIAAAVLVDDVVEEKKDAKGKVQETRRKRTPDEMKQIEDLAKAAMGFDATRGDVLSVQNVSFVIRPTETLEPTPVIERVRIFAERWLWIARYGMLLLLFVLIYALILNPVKKRLVESFEHAGELAPALAGGGSVALGQGMNAATLSANLGPPKSDLELEQELSQTNSEVERVVKMKRHLADKVKAEPAAASQLVRHWLNER